MTSNLSIMESDPFADLNMKNNTLIPKSSKLDTAEMVWTISVELIKLLLYPVNIAGNILIIYVIMRYKRLQTRLNKHLLHFTICNIVYFMFVPVFFLVHELVTMFGIPLMNFCFVYQFENVALFLCLLFGVCLGLDGFVTIYKPEVFNKYETFYKYLIQFVYTLGAMKLFVNLVLCFSGTYYIQRLLLALIYPLCLITVLALLFSKKRFLGSCNDLNKYEYSLTVSALIIFLWVPTYIFHFLYEYDESTFIRHVIIFTEFIPDFSVYGNSIILAYCLGKVNVNFKMAYDKVFKRSVRHYNNENLDDDSDDTDNFENITHILEEGNHFTRTNNNLGT